MTLRAVLFIALLCVHCSVWAHKASDSYLVLAVKGSEVIAQWDIALRDIDFAIGLDSNGDGEITWGELRARQANVAAWALILIRFHNETNSTIIHDRIPHRRLSWLDRAASTQI